MPPGFGTLRYMSLAHDPLPSDPEVLRVFAVGLQAELARKDMEIAANAAEIYAKTLHIEKLRMQCKRRSETA